MENEPTPSWVEEFVNADTVAQGLSAYRPESAAITAGRVMLDRLRTLASERRDFACETTLAGHTWVSWLEALRISGYRTHLIFLSLQDADLAVARVTGRVQHGGHDVPTDVVRRRYTAGLRNLFSIYRSRVDSWQLYDNSLSPGPRLIASQVSGGAPRIADSQRWQQLQEHST